ncbi:hypothetical protein Tco_0408113 [Tanacetum coccineum]
MRCPQHYLTDMQELILFYKGLDVPSRKILDSKGVVPSMNNANAKKAIQEMANYSQKWHNRISIDARVAIRGRYRADAPGFYQRDGGNPPYQEQRQTMEEILNKFTDKSMKRHDKKSNLIKEIQASTDATIRNQGASINALEIQIGQISKVLQEKGSRSLTNSTKKNLIDHVKSITTIKEGKISSIHRIRPNRYGVSNEQKDSRLSLIEINQANIPSPGR